MKKITLDLAGLAACLSLGREPELNPEKLEELQKTPEFQEFLLASREELKPYWENRYYQFLAQTARRALEEKGIKIKTLAEMEGALETLGGFNRKAAGGGGWAEFTPEKLQNTPELSAEEIARMVKGGQP